MGGICRYLGITLVTRYFGERFPWGTLAVNALGSFLLGWLMAVISGTAPVWLSSDEAQVFAMVGFCGGLTTFSTFSLQTFSLVAEQAWGRALGNVLGGVLLCVFCVVSGYAIGEGWTQ